LCAAWLVLPGETTLWRRVKDVLMITGAAGLLFLPWLPSMMAQSKAIRANFWATPPDRRLLLNVLSAITGVDYRALLPMQHGATTLIAVILAGTCVAAFVARKNAMRKGAALVLFGMGPVVFAYVYSWMNQPIFMERAFIASTVVLPLIFALLVDRADNLRRSAGLLVVGAISLLGIRSLQWNLLGEHPEPWREACLFAKSLESNDKHTLTVFVANEGEMLFDYYGRNSDYGLHPDRTGLPAGYFDADPPHTMRRVRGDEDLNGLRRTIQTGQFDQVTLIESHAYYGDRQHRALGLLTSIGYVIREQNFENLVVCQVSLPSLHSSR